MLDNAAQACSVGNMYPQPIKHTSPVYRSYSKNNNIINLRLHLQPIYCILTSSWDG